MGVIEDETLQVVVYPGTVNKVAAEMEGLTDCELVRWQIITLKILGKR